MPESPGVYKFLKNSRIIYVGKAINLKKRLESYFSLDLTPKTRNMVKEATAIVFIKVTSELEALLLEARLIKIAQPKYNIIAKDDKHALYIKISQDKFPIIKPVRQNGDFGPFPSTSKVYSVLRTLRHIFPYADHKPAKKACLYSQLGLCHPCPNTIKTTAEKKIYLKNIANIRKILNGDIGKVIKNLEKEMNMLSRTENYEKAVIIRNQVESLKYITQKPISENMFLKNPNLSEDITKQEQKSLQNILKIKTLNRIECYDISHISGYLATASMVTFVNGEPEKSLYRKFRIKNSKNNDVGVMSEIAERRANNIQKWGLPDLILVDGGEPQANSFRKIFDKYQIPVVAITKGRESADFPNRQALNLVTRIRDESHRFAKIYHRLLFKKNLIRI